MVPQVTGIDRHEPSIALARSNPGARDICYLASDVLDHPFEPASFDVITAAASLHHLDAASGLVKLRDLLAPVGLLAVVGLARSGPLDLPFDLAGAVVTRWHQRTKGCWEQPSPIVWPPPETFAGMRQIAGQVLPGVRYRRHVLWRYSLIWTKPP